MFLFYPGNWLLDISFHTQIQRKKLDAAAPFPITQAGSLGPGR